MVNHTRRAVLMTSGLAAAAAGITACSPESSTTSPSTGTSTGSAPSSAPGSSAPASSAPASSAPASSAPASSAPASSAPASSAAPAGPSVPVADVPVGGGVIMSSGDYVVTQPTQGTFKAFNKLCTHQGCPVTKIDTAGIHCECHGSIFAVADGSVTKGPATTPLTAATATVSGSNVVVS